MPGCGGVCAAAVVAVDLGRAVPSFEAALPVLAAGAAAELPVTVKDCGADGVFAEVAGCAAAVSLAAFDFLDFLLGVGSVPALAVVAAGCAAEVSLAALDFFDFLLGVGSVVLALAVVAVLESLVALDFFDFFVDFCSVVLASAVAADFESSAALAFFDFFAFVVLLSSVLVEVVALCVVSLVAVGVASAFFFAAANAGVNARQTTKIRIAVKDAGPFPRNFINLSCSNEWTQWSISVCNVRLIFWKRNARLR